MFRTQTMTEKHQNDITLDDYDLGLTRELAVLPDLIQLRISCHFFLQSRLRVFLGATRFVDLRPGRLAHKSFLAPKIDL